MIKNIEREREQIQRLRTQIAELEAIPNRTPQQEQELREKREELRRLENQPQDSGGGDPKNPKQPTSY